MIYCNDPSFNKKKDQYSGSAFLKAESPEFICIISESVQRNI